MDDDAAGEARARRFPVGELLFALAVTALGVYAVLDARTINVPLTAGALGPRAMPYLVGALLLASGAATVVAVLTGRTGQAEEGEDVDPHAGTHWPTVALLVGVFVAHIALIVPLGWPVAATVLFAGSAIVLGARPWWRAVLIGAALALVVQVAMVGGLGLSLPAGPLLEGVPLLGG